MRQHAHPMRRPDRRRRLRAGAIALSAVLLVALGLAIGPLLGASPGGLTAAPNQVVANEPTAGGVAAGDASAQAPAPPTPEPTPEPTDTPAIAPAHIPLDAWPPIAPIPVAELTGYDWPIAHPRLTLPFGPTPWGSRVVDGQKFHDGVDLATFCDDRVVAAHDGVVLAAGRQFDNFLGWVGSLDAYYQRLNVHHLWGELPNVVVIDDGNTYRSVYAHMWKVVVKPGQRVKAGQLIGKEGRTGRASGCHLHYSLFSPYESATFGIEPKVVKEMRLPTLEIARVDPLLVLPYRKGLGGRVENLGG